MTSAGAGPRTLAKLDEVCVVLDAAADVGLLTEGLGDARHHEHVTSTEEVDQLGRVGVHAAMHRHAVACFDLAPGGDFKLGREAAHSRNRIVHAHGDRDRFVDRFRAGNVHHLNQRYSRQCFAQLSMAARGTWPSEGFKTSIPPALSDGWRPPITS